MAVMAQQDNNKMTEKSTNVTINYLCCGAERQRQQLPWPQTEENNTMYFPWRTLHSTTYSAWSDYKIKSRDILWSPGVATVSSGNDPSFDQVKLSWLTRSPSKCKFGFAVKYMACLGLSP